MVVTSLQVPHDPNTPYDMTALVRRVLDDRELTEISPNCAPAVRATRLGGLSGRE